MFYIPCEFGGLSNLYIYVYMIIVLSSSLLRLQSCYSNVVATPLCTTPEFSDRALAHWSPNSLCSGQLSSRHSFQPITSGGKCESAPFLPMLPRSLRLFTGHGYHVIHGARVRKVLSVPSTVVAWVQGTRELSTCTEHATSASTW